MAVIGVEEIGGRKGEGGGGGEERGRRKMRGECGDTTIKARVRRRRQQETRGGGLIGTLFKRRGDGHNYRLKASESLEDD